MKDKQYKYFVALSFAGEQRTYVERVSKELSRLNIKHFYDYNEQESLWGKDLARYLSKLYYEDAQYFVPFISKEYAEKVWPSLELSAAFDRNIHELRPDYQRYILPVYFDDTYIHGIPKTMGFYMANEIEPERLAQAIKKKLKAEICLDIAPNAEPHDCKRDVNRATLPMCNLESGINNGPLSQLLTACKQDDASRAIIVYGEKGLGKRSCIVKTLLDMIQRNVFYIKPVCEEQYQYENIIRSLALEVDSSKFGSGTNYSAEVKSQLLRICAEDSSVIYIEHFHKFNHPSQVLLIEIVYTLITRYAQSGIDIIIEYDTDISCEAADRFFEFPVKYTTFIPFKKLSNQDIEKCFHLFCGEVQISKSNLDYILRASSGNIMYLNIIINYLRGEQYFQEKQGVLVCKQLPKDALLNVLQKYIIQRYEKLDPMLRDLLGKSSIVGNVFQTELLEKPFQIINANEKLDSIEKISNLIERRTDDTYVFETEDICRLIQDSISESQRKEWHIILAHYFEKAMQREKNRSIHLTPEREISYTYPIARHFKCAQEYSAALHVYLQLITSYLKICDYSNARETIQTARSVAEYVDLDETSDARIEYTLQRNEALCLKGLGLYEEAYEKYKAAQAHIDSESDTKEYIEISFQMAYCLYMTGKVNEARQRLLSLCDRFHLRENDIDQFIKAISLLASICDATNDTTTQKKYYIEALTYHRECKNQEEYYKLLRMASMVFDLTLAIDMEKEAETYFRGENNIRMLAETLHNIATDELYLFQTQDISKNLSESISLFDRFGSRAVHYPLNSKGIMHMAVNHDFDKAMEAFSAALEMSTEIYSEIAIRTNMTQCLIQVKDFDKATAQIEKIETLMVSGEPIPIYDTLFLLNLSFLTFHQQQYDACEMYLRKFSKLSNCEPRHVYLAKALRNQLKKAQGLKTRNTAGTPPFPAYQESMKRTFFFATLRFYE